LRTEPLVTNPVLRSVFAMRRNEDVHIGQRH
jgi:hypothetical protein